MGDPAGIYLPDLLESDLCPAVPIVRRVHIGRDHRRFAIQRIILVEIGGVIGAGGDQAAHAFFPGDLVDIVSQLQVFQLAAEIDIIALFVLAEISAMHDGVCAGKMMAIAVAVFVQQVHDLDAGHFRAVLVGFFAHRAGTGHSARAGLAARPQRWCRWRRLRLLFVWAWGSPCYCSGGLWVFYDSCRWKMRVSPCWKTSCRDGSSRKPASARTRR